MQAPAISAAQRLPLKLLDREFCNITDSHLFGKRAGPSKIQMFNTQGAAPNRRMSQIQYGGCMICVPFLGAVPYYSQHAIIFMTTFCTIIDNSICFLRL
jgi:hypothetical protein